MATTGKVSGNMLLIYIEGVAVACSTEATATITNETIEVTCKDNDGAKTYILGGQDWNFTVGGIFQFDNVGADDISDLAVDQTLATIRFGTEVVGDFFLEGDAYVSNFQITAPVNNVATYSATFSAAGPITKGTTT